MYSDEWYNSGDIVPDQVSPASDAMPIVHNAVGAAGISNEYSCGDHQHPLQVSTILSSADTATGEAGTAAAYASIRFRNRNSRHIKYICQCPALAPPPNVDPTVTNVLLVNATATANVMSDYYCRNDHVHPQQLTYDRNITAIKSIKTGVLSTEILCANGDTTTIDSKFSRTYSSGNGGYIRLCVFAIGTSTGAPYIQFQVQYNTNTMQTIDLVHNYTVNGIADLYGVFTAPSYVQLAYNIYYGADKLLLTHTGSYSTAVYTAWIHMISDVGSVTVTVSNQSPFMTNRITEILTQDIVSYISGSQTQIPISYNLGNGGIINNMLKVNPMVNVGTDQTITGKKTFAGVTSGKMQINPIATSYDDGLRISRSDTNTVISLASEAGDNTRGLQISADGNTLSFNRSVIAGTGASNGATNRSVNYSAGNPILWGQNSTDPIGRFYSDGAKVY
ncbi:MAG: hypothetical protein EZS28_006306 [Streblomastix strix]|uniref:Uncharacterized protein n=1 Tax=Streblomastix strix TaxID=222440 RepID=A0A5J4WUD0_9EUKA|nr:MAG: hypothetical protein EZS28_006306 [Streblomastix strix]